MARPRPTPPWRRASEESACTKGGLLGGRDADAGVGDADLELVRESNDEANEADVGEFDGVGEEVDEDLAEAGGLADEMGGDGWADIDEEVDPFGIGLQEEGGDDFVDERDEKEGIGSGNGGFAAEF